MKMLFSKKPYTEGLVLSENHLRGYIRLEAFSFLSEENQNELLKEVEKYFSELKNAIIFYNIENEVFLSIEPLLHSIEKERLKEMTDFIIQEIENLGE